MSQLHHLLTFPSRPVTGDYVTSVRKLLASGIPATYTLEQVAAFEKNGTDEMSESASNTTPLHILARSLPLDLSEDETSVVLSLMDTLFEYGAGWNFIDYEDKTVGDLLVERGQKKTGALYQRVVDAGVSAELLLRKLNGGEIEFLEDPQHAEEQQQQEADSTADNQQVYLSTKLEYNENALVTRENRDGVMMDWETHIMELAANTICRKDAAELTVLNIGFGMGIIDNFIASHSPHKHYICEAHPDVLAKMRADGWYDRPNVVVLEGRWQDSLNALLDQGSLFFDGIYYDTFSEHYQDMLDLYDVVVGLLKPDGVFSFFNGLGADRPLCYDVYNKIVSLDLQDYGLQCQYTTISVPTDQQWHAVKRSYFNCDYYYHPQIRFR
ncbi:hypothetical protein HG536_0A06120 [Torulaspora globosa]|uniref:Arginine N-methyltransferase 2 n=1 Tax=Torulaspora globosa TaxID=48254 RepID=A0A7G3ZBB1_9SACH|nr:uncharacterized protein HG536_0A06120 [Torulaspora globosa]QLL30797.1 hypothetical protein HG536_0A06120 [Torulaspora globosa]